jgi:hypothetical protein
MKIKKGIKIAVPTDGRNQQENKALMYQKT